VSYLEALDELAVQSGGRYTASEIECTLTPEQIELRYFWLIKRRTRAIDDQKVAVALAIGLALGGS